MSELTLVFHVSPFTQLVAHGILRKELTKVDLNWVATKTEHDIFKEKVHATAEQVDQLSNEVSALTVLLNTSQSMLSLLGQ